MEKLTSQEFDIIVQALYNSNVRVADAPIILKLIEKILKIKEETQNTYEKTQNPTKTITKRQQVGKCSAGI
jgi:hypothetical protein